jgi:cytochrome c oxidase subunit III
VSDPSFSRPRSTRGREPALERWSTAQLGMYVTLASLTMLFGASLVAYLITRAQNDVWRTADMPPLPAGLAVSSVLLIGTSASLRWAIKALRRNAFSTLERALWLAGAFALAFLLAQIQNWRTMAAASLPAETQTLYAFTFYALTALHALHVVAGFVPLGIVIAHARNKQYSSSRSEGVRLCAQYWDYLLVVWFVLLIAITLTT